MDNKHIFLSGSKTSAKKDKNDPVRTYSQPFVIQDGDHQMITPQKKHGSNGKAELEKFLAVDIKDSEWKDYEVLDFFIHRLKLIDQ